MKKNLHTIVLGIVAVTLFVLLIKEKSNKLQQTFKSGNEAIVKVIVEEKNEQEANNIQKLNSLNLSNQDLAKLPEYVVSKTNLEELNISNNNISGALPAEIRHLQNLRVLKASNNKMTGVPAEVGQLKKLEVLDLSNNQLTGLPYELGNLKNLKILNLSGNNYAKQDLERIKEGLPASVEIIL